MSYYQSSGGGFLSSLPDVTRNLIIINIIVFIPTLINENLMLSNFALFFPASRFFHFWQPLTHMFMHGSFTHILFNMYTLFIFGSAVENTIGSKKFLVFYLLTGLGAALMHTGVQYLQYAAGSASVLYVPTVGASGAIYGVLMAYAMLYPDSIMTLIFPPVSMKAKWFVLIFAVIEFLTGVGGTMDGIAHFAHLGGMVFGFILLRWWKRSGRLWDRGNWI